MGKQFKATSKLTAKFLVVLMVLQAVLFSLTALGATVDPNKITKIVFGDKGKATVKIGAPTTHDLVVTPNRTNVTGVTYSNSTPAVATFDALTGKITAISPGTTTITASVAVYGATKDTQSKLVVTVPVPVTAMVISLDGKKPVGDTLGLNTGTKKITLKVAFTGMKVNGKDTLPTDKGVTWSTSDKTVADIDTKGAITVTGAVYSKATITAKSTDGGIIDTVEVTVGKLLTGIKAVNSALVIKAGITNGKPINIAANPVDASIETVSGQTYTYKSSDLTTVGVTVTGLVYGVKGGSAKITVTAKPADGSAAKTTTVTVTVVTDITDVTLAAFKAKAVGTAENPLNVYSKLTLKAGFLPKTAKSTSIRYSSGSPLVAFVNAYTGEVTALTAGSSVITATAVNSAGVAKAATITIYTDDADGLLTP